MLADALPGVPVLIGPRRVASGARAVEEFGAEVCVLDDAFQYWRLRKDLEIVLIDAAAPLGYGYLLPRGLLREPPRSMRRADVVILMNGFRLPEERRAQLMRELMRWAPRALLLEGCHRPTELRELFTEDLRPLEWLAGRRVAALSSLGNPDGFEQTLWELGARAVVPRRFPDHHRYTTEEAIASCELASAGSRGRGGPPGEATGRPPAGADRASASAHPRVVSQSPRLHVEAVVTTAKDAPKLREALGTRPAAGPVPVLVLEIDLDLGDGEGALVERVLGRLSERDRNIPTTNQAD
jgi:tetraacyldisaccharide-1-P 4'-kinase